MTDQGGEASARVHTCTITLGDKEIHLETGRLAKQASGAVLVRLGDTMVLVTAVVAKNERNVDFFPLTVDVEEGMYAAGKIPGGFIKKEGRPSDQAILNARLIDRPIRPLWPAGFNRETHIVATVLSVDKTNPYDVLALLGASAALSLSEAPFQGPIGAVRVAKVDGRWVINPTFEEVDASPINLVVAGTDDAISMVEAGCLEIQEADLLEAMALAHLAIQEQVAAIRAWAAEVGAPKMEVAERRADPELVDRIRQQFGAGRARARGELRGGLRTAAGAPGQGDPRARRRARLRVHPLRAGTGAPFGRADCQRGAGGLECPLSGLSWHHAAR